MDIFLDEHKEFLTRLVKAKVKFILIGGYAVNYHGYNRTTGDMDIWVKPDNKNRDLLLRFFLDEGYQPKLLEKLKAFDFSKPVVFHIGKPPMRIDFLTIISRVKFSEGWQKRESLPLGGLKVPVLHLHHLVLSKMGTGRAKDIGDIEELQKISKSKKGKP
jgi:predicted nucleotidyltransferase